MRNLLTRCLGNALLVGLCQISFSGSAFADQETLARFRKEYPEASKRIEDVYSHIAIGSRISHFEAGNFRSERMCHFIRDGSRFCLTNEMLTTHTNAFGARFVFLRNDSFFILAFRKDIASETIVRNALPATEKGLKDTLQLCFEVMEPPPLNLYGLRVSSDWSYPLLKMFDWEAAQPDSEEAPNPFGFPATLVDAEPVDDGDTELVKLHCKTSAGYTAEFVLSPNDSWALVAYRVEFPESQVLNGRHEFQGAYKGVPLIKSCEYFFKLKYSGKEELRETSLKAEVMFIVPEPEFAEAIFEPNSFGIHFIPPVPAVESTTSLKWPWFLLAGSISVPTLALYLRRIARQAGITRATPP